MSVGSITEEIDACDFGDWRLKTRLQLIAQRLLEKPNMSIPSACNSRAEMEAAYRFFGNPNVTPDEILNSHASASLARVKKSNITLLVQDTTEIDLTRPDSVVSGAGPLSSDTQLGAFYHPMMAFEPSG
ncbi:MAG: transposase DNA-binding-containing protein, partial [Planctomycetota bacterium]